MLCSDVPVIFAIHLAIYRYNNHTHILLYIIINIITYIIHMSIEDVTLQLYMLANEPSWRPQNHRAACGTLTVSMAEELRSE